MLLGVLALAPSPLTLYLTWAGLGVCMAASLYEPAFALVTRAHDSTEARLRALAIVTLCGGLASTVFVPLTDRLVTWTGWRGAVAILAGLLGASTATTAVAVRRIAMATPRVSHPKLEAAVITTSTDVRVLALVFGMSSFVSSSFIANLVPALGERGLPPASAALLGGLFGAMQLPGRALMLSRRVHLSGDTLLVLSSRIAGWGPHQRRCAAHDRCRSHRRDDVRSRFRTDDTGATPPGADSRRARPGRLGERATRPCPAALACGRACRRVGRGDDHESRHRARVPRPHARGARVANGHRTSRVVVGCVRRRCDASICSHTAPKRRRRPLRGCPMSRVLAHHANSGRCR